MGEIQKSLECPFTWKIDEKLAREFDEDQEITVEIEEQPVLALINSLSMTYFLAVQERQDDALKKLNESLEILEKLDKRTTEKDEISHDVLVHVAKSTAYHVYKLTGMCAEAQTTWDELADSRSFRSKLEVGTICGCNAIVWSCFHEAGCQAVVPLAEAAVANSPSCSLWRYVLGKNLRHVRRNVDGLHKPAADEMAHLAKSYELSRIPFYGINVAQMHRENESYKQCREIYAEIYESRPTGIGINLRLARAFTAFGNFDKAEECLDRVGRLSPNNSMYLHYKGCLYRKQRRSKEAALYLEQSAMMGNFRADMDYAEVKEKSSKGAFNYLGHLTLMLQRHDRFKQTILLHMAMQFYRKRNDLESALKTLLKAIEVNPDNKQLKNFRNITINWNEYLDIFDLVSRVLVPSYTRGHPIMSTEMDDVLRRLKDHCRKQIRTSDYSLAASLQKMNL